MWASSAEVGTGSQLANQLGGRSYGTAGLCLNRNRNGFDEKLDELILVRK